MKTINNQPKGERFFLTGLTLVIIVIILMATCQSCMTITGTVSAVNNDTVTVNKYRFKVKNNVPVVGQTVTFKATKNRKKVNCKHIKNN